MWRPAGLQALILLVLWNQYLRVGSQESLNFEAPGRRSMSRPPKFRAVDKRLDNATGFINGDVIIGGLFSIRRGDYCDKWTNVINIRRVEAMLFAIDRINADHSILPNIRLGTDIRDDCFSGTVALEQSLNFVLNAFGQNGNICSVQGETRTPVMGVVGTGSSGTSLPVASFLRLFRLPQVSYAATSPDLSNRDDYEYFMRVVPSDLYQVQAIIDVIAVLKWTAVFLISSQGNYGQRIKEAFVHQANGNKSLCIVDKMELGNDFLESNDTVLKFIRNMNKSSVRGVVLLTEDFHTKYILESVRNANISYDRFLWFGSDTWGTGQDLDGIETVASGAITIALHAPMPNRPIVQDFDRYFERLTPVADKNSRNPWFIYLWESVFQCFLPGNKKNTNYTKQCKGNETYSGNWTDDKVAYVLDAVYALAHSLDLMLRDKCPAAGNWSECMWKLARENMARKLDLLDYLRKVNFSGASGMVGFDMNGSGLARYDIMRYARDKYKKLATWKMGEKLDLSKLYKEGINMDTLESSCSQLCLPGEKRVYSKLSSVRCCWTCQKCPKYQYVDSQHQCQSCAEGNRTNRNRTGCVPLPTGRPAAYVVIILTVWATLGLLVTAFVAYTMYKFYSTPIIMATGRELMLVLLGGIASCLLLGFTLLGPPNVEMCGFQRFSSGLFLSVCYSAILVKTNRIARIFRGSHRPAFITPGPQLLITSLLVCVQIGICLAVSIFGGMSEATMYHGEDFAYMVCRTSGVEYIVSLSYNALLLLTSTFYAFLTRKLPANFNEAKKIGITMYATCVLWLCFLPLFYGTSPIYRTAVLLLNSCFNATVLLIGMFGNMVYVVWFRPEKNTRQASNPRGRTSSSYSQHSIPASLSMENINGVINGSRATMRRFSSKVTLESFTGVF